jgi:hypothetical protein
MAAISGGKRVGKKNLSNEFAASRYLRSLRRHGANQLASTTRSDSLVVNRSHRISGCEQSLLRNSGSSRLPYGNKGTRNYMAPMAQSQWDSRGKTQPRKKQRWCTRLPSVTYPQRTVLCFTILALEHLDAYLAYAAVIIDQRDEPG